MSMLLQTLSLPAFLSFSRMRDTGLIDLVERILKRCDHNVDTGCMVYTGSLFDDGYAKVRLGKKFIRGHRAVLALKMGVALEALPRTTLARHSCDNRACCNAEHISPGSNADNVKDKVSRGRQARVPTNGVKMSIEFANYVRAIDNGFVHGPKEKTRALAKRVGVSVRAIERMRVGTRWKAVK
jgi:hypothetical protein